MSKVSIIVPIFNKENDLEKCLKSIKSQSFSNLEIILINDGSMDNSGEICDYWKTVDSRIQVRHKKNEGVSVARNLGISLATGDYLCFVDPDDWLSPNLVEQLVNAAEKNKSDITSCCAYIAFNNEQIMNSFFQVSDQVIDKNRAIAQLLTDGYYNDTDKLMDIGVPWGKLYRKDFIEDWNLTFEPSLRRNQDNIFNLYAFQHANQIYYINEPLYYYKYDNINGFFYDYSDNDDILFSDLAKATFSFVREYYDDDKLMNDLSDRKIYGLLQTIIRRKIFNPAYQIDFSQRVNSLTDILKQEPFAEIFKRRTIKHTNMIQKIVFLLIKRKKYRLTYIIVRSWWGMARLREDKLEEATR